MSLIEDLNWRYAAKHMVEKEMPEEKLNVILEAIRLAPTSLGLQLFQVIVIKDKDLKNKIFAEAAQHQEMIPNSSYLLVFAAKTNASSADLNEYAELTAQIRNVPVESLDRLKAAYGSFLDGMPAEQKIEWSAKQTYIAMSYATVAAANEGIDCTPVEGFNPQIVDEILDLKSQNLTSTLLLPLGYRNEEIDYLANSKKVRKSIEQLVVYK